MPSFPDWRSNEIERRISWIIARSVSGVNFTLPSLPSPPVSEVWVAGILPSWNVGKAADGVSHRSETVRRASAPAFHHSRIGNGVEGRVHLHHFEMLRIPREPIGGRHPFRVPALHKTGVRPTCRADENPACGGLNRLRCAHQSRQPQLPSKSTAASQLMGLRIESRRGILPISRRGVEQSGSSSGS